jgi:ribosome recycling factor
MIKAFDHTILGAIDKAIQAENLGVNPQNDGKIIRISIPPLSEDRRKQLAEHVKKLGETAKVHIRNVRRDTKKAIEDAHKEKKISEDQKFRSSDDLQKLTEKFEKKVDELAEKKAKEVMEM